MQRKMKKLGFWCVPERGEIPHTDDNSDTLGSPVTERMFYMPVALQAINEVSATPKTKSNEVPLLYDGVTAPGPLANIPSHVDIESLLFGPIDEGIAFSYAD